MLVVRGRIASAHTKLQPRDTMPRGRSHRGLLQEELVLGDGVGGEESPQHPDGGLEQVDHALAIVETKGCLQPRRWAREANGEHGHGVAF